MNTSDKGPEASREAAIDALLEIGDEQLFFEIGSRAGSMQYKPTLAGADVLAPAPVFNHEGFGDDILDAGRRIFASANRDLCSVVCGTDPKNEIERAGVLKAVEFGENGLAAVISGVLIGSFGLAPVVATVAATLIVKRVFRASGEELCGGWALAAGITISRASGGGTHHAETSVSGEAVSAPVLAVVQSDIPAGAQVRAQIAPAVPPSPRPGAGPLPVPKPGQKITMEQLIKLVENPDTPRDQLRQYFRLDTTRSDAYNPQIVINQDLVGPSRYESNTVLSIFNGFEMGRRQDAYASRIEELGDKALRLVSEGDSWFQYPFMLNDVIDQLFDRYPIYSLGAAGDVLSNMVRSERLDQVIAQNKAHGLLFSGGGNDFLGDGRLSQNLRRNYKPGMEAPDYINSQFLDCVASIESNYRILFDRLTTRFPDLFIFCHGYDYALPQPGGKWLGAPLLAKGIEDPHVQRLIIVVMVDYFNDMMANLASEYGGKVVFVDCRNVAQGPQDWYDELHPTDAGFARAAANFKRYIDASIPLKT